MYPTIAIGYGEIGTYGLMVALGAIAVVFIAAALEKNRGYLPYDYLGAFAWVVPCALAGAIVLYGITNIPYLIEIFSTFNLYENVGAFLLDIVLAFSGMVFYGGMLGALGGYYIWLHRTKRPKNDYLDMFAVCLPLFHGFARIGCFLGGCCFGIESPFGFTYTINPIEMANGVPRFPVQLLESACEFILFGILYALYNKKTLRGQLIWVWAGSYGVVRFLDEFLRGDFYRGFLGPFSTSQWISLILIGATIVHCVHRWNRSRKSNPRSGHPGSELQG